MARLAPQTSRRLAGLLLALLLPATSGCFITNAAGHQPSRSYAGEELRLLIARHLALGWMLGGETYIDSKKQLLADGDAMIPLAEYRDFPEWFNLAFLMTYNNTPVAAGRFYREKAADDCLNTIQLSASMLSLIYFESLESTRTVTTKTSAVEMKFVSDSDFQLAIPFTQPVLDFCRFEETGKLIESKDYSL